MNYSNTRIEQMNRDNRKYVRISGLAIKNDNMMKKEIEIL